MFLLGDSLRLGRQDCGLGGIQAVMQSKSVSASSNKCGFVSPSLCDNSLAPTYYLQQVTVHSIGYHVTNQSGVISGDASITKTETYTRYPRNLPYGSVGCVPMTNATTLSWTGAASYSDIPCSAVLSGAGPWDDSFWSPDDNCYDNLELIVLQTAPLAP